MRARPRSSALQPVLRGLVAGVLGTAVMTATQTLAARLQSSDDGSGGPGRDPWEDAPAPAKVARLASERILGARPSADLIPLLTNVMHWGTGIGWGGVFGALARLRRGDGGLGSDLVFGTGVWTMSYVQLVPLGIYEPPWRYPLRTLALDLSYHLAYGAGTGVGYRMLDQQ